jgi:hypothetical protein
MQIVFVVGWKLGLALVIGIPALSGLGVYLVAGFTHASDPYSEEVPKLLAQLHNLDKLVEQTRVLKATTETVKAKLSEEVWSKQQRWPKRLDTYVAIIEALQRFQEATLGSGSRRSTPKQSRGTR